MVTRMVESPYIKGKRKDILKEIKEKRSARKKMANGEHRVAQMNSISGRSRIAARRQSIAYSLKSERDKTIDEILKKNS